MTTIIDTTGTTTSINGRPVSAQAQAEQPLPNGVKRVRGGTLTHASRQWASRPADQQVWTIDELVQRTQAVRNNSRQVPNVAWGDLRVMPHANGEDLCLTRGGATARFTHWSLGQFCTLPSSDGSGSIANHAFVGKLTAKTAAIVLNERIAAGVARQSPAQLLFARDGEHVNLRSLTTDKYTRIWDAEIAERLAVLCQRGTWQPAEAFRTAKGVADTAWGESKKLPLGWLSDRDMFVVLVDYEGSVTVNGNTYSRFVMLSHSEVGDGALWLMWGLFDFACSNMLFWGCRDVFEVNLRHSQSIGTKWVEIAKQVQLPAMTSGDRADLTRGIIRAQNMLLGDKVEEVLAVAEAATKLPKNIVAEAQAVAAKTPRYGNPNSVWALFNGLTEVSQTKATNTDRRVQIDAAAARLMALVK